MNHTLLGPVASCKWDEIIPETKVIYIYIQLYNIYIIALYMMRICYRSMGMLDDPRGANLSVADGNPMPHSH